MVTTVSNNFENKTVDEVAAILASVAVEAREKRASPNFGLGDMQLPSAGSLGAVGQLGGLLGSAALGGTVGGLVGAGSQVFRPKKDRNYLSGLLGGGAIGAGLGLGGNYLVNAMANHGASGQPPANDELLKSRLTQSANQGMPEMPADFKPSEDMFYKPAFDIKQYMPDMKNIGKQLSDHGINADAQRHIGYTLGGAGLGGLLGAGSQLFAPQKKRRYLSNAITGGLLGAGAGLGGSLIASNMPSDKPSPVEVEAAQRAEAAKLKANANAAGGMKPEMQAAAKNWGGMDTGNLTMLRRNVDRYGPDAAIPDFLTVGNQMKHTFSVPAGKSYKDLKLMKGDDPRTGKPYVNTYSMAEQDPERMKQIAADMAASVEGGEQWNVPEVARGVGTALRTGNVKPLLGQRTRFGENRDNAGILPDIGARWNKNTKLDVNSPAYQAAVKELATMGLTPTELLGAHADGSAAMQALKDRILTQQRTYNENGVSKEWQKDQLNNELPGLIDKLRSDLGRKSMLEDYGPTTGNSYFDAGLVGAGWQGAHMARKAISGGYMEDRLRDAINSEKSLKQVAGNNPRMEALLREAAKTPAGVKPGLMDYIRRLPGFGRKPLPTAAPSGLQQLMNDPKGYANTVQLGADGKAPIPDRIDPKGKVITGNPAVPYSRTEIPTANTLRDLASKGKLIPNKLRTAGGVVKRVGLPLLLTELLLGRGNLPLDQAARLEEGRKQKWGK